jgi:hypothetical protein
MPKYFRQSRLSSFHRQLKGLGINNGPDAGGYYHELFLRGYLRSELIFTVLVCQKLVSTAGEESRLTMRASTPTCTTFL